MQFIPCLLFSLLVSGSFAIGNPDQDGTPEENLSNFVKEKLLQYRELIVGEGLDPLRDNGAKKDLFVTNPTFEIGGDIWGVSLSGFSKYEKIEVSSFINFDTNPPNQATGNFKIKYEQPTILTGQYKLSGFVNNANGTQTPLRAEGYWTINCIGFKNDSNNYWVRDDILDQYSFFPSFTLQNGTLSIPGLIADDIPFEVAEYIKAKIIDEIWFINEFYFHTNNMWLKMMNYLSAEFEKHPFTGIIADPETMRSRSDKSGPFWQMDMFLGKAMNRFHGTPVDGLDPLEGLDININMTFPSYLRLAGTLSNLTFHGISEIQLDRTYSHAYPARRLFEIYCLYPTTVLTGLGNPYQRNQDWSGTIETNGNLIPIDGKDRIFKLTTVPAQSMFRFGFSVGEDRRITVYHGEVQGMFLTSQAPGYYRTDLDGLLDKVTDQNLVQNAISWITTEVTDRQKIMSTIAQRIHYRLLKVLQAQFDKTTIDEILAIQPPTK